MLITDTWHSNNNGNNNGTLALEISQKFLIKDTMEYNKYKYNIKMLYNYINKSNWDVTLSLRELIIIDQKRISWGGVWGVH